MWGLLRHPGERLAVVLERYPFIQQLRNGHGAELSVLMHREDHVATLSSIRVASSGVCRPGSPGERGPG